MYCFHAKWSSLWEPGFHDSSVAQPQEDVGIVRAESSYDWGLSSDDLFFLAFSNLYFQIFKFWVSLTILTLRFVHVFIFCLSRRNVGVCSCFVSKLAGTEYISVFLYFPACSHFLIFLKKKNELRVKSTTYCTWYDKVWRIKGVK